MSAPLEVICFWSANALHCLVVGLVISKGQDRSRCLSKVEIVVIAEDKSTLHSWSCYSDAWIPHAWEPWLIKLKMAMLIHGWWPNKNRPWDDILCVTKRAGRATYMYVTWWDHPPSPCSSHLRTEPFSVSADTDIQGLLDIWCWNFGRRQACELFAAAICNSGRLFTTQDWVTSYF